MELIRLRQYDNYVSANIAKNFLESNDIICFLQDEFTSTIVPMWDIANGGIKLLIHKDDKTKAEELLVEMEEAVRTENN